MVRVMIRSKLADDEDGDFSEPWAPSYINPSLIPRAGEQIFDVQGDRAFAVQTVEYHYGMKSEAAFDYAIDEAEVHLFCIEFPRVPPPEAEEETGEAN